MLTTQCPSCSARLRFAPETLAATQGWARCGVCQKPFEAWQHATMPVLQADAGGVPTRSQADASPAALAADVPPAAHSNAAASLHVPPAYAVTDSDATAQVEPDLGEAKPEWDIAPQLDAEPLTAGAAMPGRPATTGRWGLAALALTGALLVQVAVWQFDRVVSYVPVLVPTVQSACQLLGCEVPYPSSVGRAGIGQSSLVRVSSTNFRLDIELINGANFAVRTPVAEVTLFDADERVLVRRVWPWTQPLPSTLAAGQRLGTQLLWSMSAQDAQRVVRYVVKLHDS